MISEGFVISFVIILFSSLIILAISDAIFRKDMVKNWIEAVKLKFTRRNDFVFRKSERRRASWDLIKRCSEPNVAGSEDAKEGPMYGSPLSSIGDSMNFDIARDGFLMGKLIDARNNSLYKAYISKGFSGSDEGPGASDNYDGYKASLLMKAGIPYEGGFSNLRDITISEVESSLKALKAGVSGAVSFRKCCLRIDLEITELSRKLSVIGFDSYASHILDLRGIALSIIEGKKYEK